MSDDKPISRSEMRMLAQAQRNGWDVPDDTKALAVERIHRIIDDPQMSARDKIAAIKALVAINGQNIEIERNASGSFEVRGSGTPSVTIIMPSDDASGQAQGGKGES